MPDRHIWLSKETEAKLERLQVRYSLNRSAVIAKLVAAVKEDEPEQEG